MATLNQSAITLANAKIRVAKTSGVQNDSDWLAVAEECIRHAIRKWEQKRTWSWLFVDGADITLMAGTAEYALPAGFRKMYSVRINDTYIIPIHQRLYDIANPANTGGSNAWFYSMFPAGQTSMIRLYPTPTSVAAPSDKLKIRYLRKIDVTASTLDIPEAWEDGVIAHAKALFLADRGGEDQRMLMWQQAGDEALANAIRDDFDMPDMREAFTPPAMTDVRPWNPNSLDTLLSNY